LTTVREAAFELFREHGRLGKPVEFGHKAQLVDNDDGVVLDHTVEQGNPPDAPSWHPPSNNLAAQHRCVRYSALSRSVASVGH
jgi:hypothetical protein